MAMPKHICVRGLWERLEEEIDKQNISKTELARRCGFERKVLYGYSNIHLPYFARLCAELNVSADYLLFGKKR